jgi:hypothetical protein
MFLKKQVGSGSRAEGRQRVAVMAEPLPGHDTEEVVTRLRAAGAQAIEVLAPGFVSAALERGRLCELEDVAEINVKPRKRPLGAAR